MTHQSQIQDRLLRAIVADPADRGVRAVYADWLQENGEEARGEWIAVELALAGLPPLG